MGHKGAIAVGVLNGLIQWLREAVLWESFKDHWGTCGYRLEQDRSHIEDLAPKDSMGWVASYLLNTAGSKLLQGAIIPWDCSDTTLSKKARKPRGMKKMESVVTVAPKEDMGSSTICIKQAEMIPFFSVPSATEMLELSGVLPRWLHSPFLLTATKMKG